MHFWSFLAMIALLVISEETAGVRMRTRSRISRPPPGMLSRTIRIPSIEQQELNIKKAVKSALVEQNLEQLESQDCSLEKKKAMLMFGQQEKGLWHYPTCMDVMACSGCCLGKRICTPTVKEFSVLVMEIKAPHIADIKKTDISKANFINVNTTTHTACKCECPDKYAKMKCKENGMSWNDLECFCECHYNLVCAGKNGYFFNKATCLCESKPEYLDLIRQLENDLIHQFSKKK